METLRDFLPVVAILFILMALFSFASRRRQAPKETARDQLDELKQRKRMRDDLGNLMVEVEELTRRFSAQIDAKTVRLERLIQEAEIRIDQLNEMERRQASRPVVSAEEDAGGIEGAGVGAGAEPGRAVEGQSSPMQRLTRSVHVLADEGHEPVDIAEKLGEPVGKVELILALRAGSAR